MRIQTISCILLLLFIGCSSEKNSKSTELTPESSQMKVDSFFNVYFVYLDSIASGQKTDFSHKKLQATVLELEYLSGLAAQGEMTKQSNYDVSGIDTVDINMWKEWYNNKKKNFVWDTTYEGIKMIADSSNQ